MTPQNVSSPPLSPQSKHHKSVIPFVIGGIILVFALSLGGYLFYTNQSLTISTPTPTQNTIQSNLSPTLNTKLLTPPPNFQPDTLWKTWISQADQPGARITFDYPGLYNSPQRRQNILNITSPLDPIRGKDAVVKNNEYNDNELRIEFTWIDETNLKETIASFVEKERNLTSRKVSNENKMTLNGKEIVFWESEEGSNSGKTYFFITNNKKVIVQKYPAKSSRDSEFEKILSSFKFF